MSKKKSIIEAVALIPNGSILALGGNTFHRSPAGFARELARQQKRDLQIIKTAGAYDVDLLSAAGSLSVVHAGYIGFENLGLAPRYREFVEQGKIKAAEHACYSIVAALRAAVYGIPFQPIQGFQKSSLPSVRDFKWIKNPYGEEEILTVPALHPDFAVIHVHEADEDGNGRIYGSIYEDKLMSLAAKHVILTTEKIVPKEQLQTQPELNTIPGFLVSAVVELPGGALPGACQPLYDADYQTLANYLKFNQEEMKY